MYPWLPTACERPRWAEGSRIIPPRTRPHTYVTNIGNVPIPKDTHAKIIFYSRGLPDPHRPNETRYPFNVEMNINHEYWHLRENDPGERALV